MDYVVAQVNVGRLVAPLDSPQLADFTANLDPVSAVADTAPGFDPARSEGLGLAGLRERIESIGGQFETLTGPGGTRLVITLSVEEQP